MGAASFKIEKRHTRWTIKSSKKRADEALEQLYRKLATASDRYDFEPDFNSGALSVEFEEPKTKFVVSPEFARPSDLGFGPFKEFQTRLGPRAIGLCSSRNGPNIGTGDDGRHLEADRRTRFPVSSDGQASTFLIRSARRSARTVTSPQASGRANCSSATTRCCWPRWRSTPGNGSRKPSTGAEARPA